MVDAKRRLIAPAIALLAGIALSGCEASKDGEFPYPPAVDTSAPGVARFKIDLANSVLDVPYPYDFYFATAAALGEPVDGTQALPAGLPWRTAAMQRAISSLDGWSTTASLSTGFSQPLGASSIGAGAVKIIKLWLDPSTKAPTTNPAYLPREPRAPSPAC